MPLGVEIARVDLSLEEGQSERLVFSDVCGRRPRRLE